ncbi:hypothetical protein BcDW1_8769 [Botrytis cinerea BcDW1]|uniref:F-box domain-containing protein n=1 Tax=Botryotinia fuckeliana (strain BcDW1) TaxID=1290391 RepID=M7TGD3_BOTF1|nr:hypothetical protein BcDW1_8769 [Botrytis cinerea BcDW1]
MSNKRLSPLPVFVLVREGYGRRSTHELLVIGLKSFILFTQFETLVQDMANQNQRTTIPNTETPVEAVGSKENIEDMEKTQTILSSQALINTEIYYQQRVELPQEVLCMICSHVDPNKLGNLRFVSEDFSLAAATHLFKEISFKFEDS